MSLTEAILEKVRSLPPGRQQEVLDFVEFLQHKEGGTPRLRSPYGLWADLSPPITAEEIDAARREMWGNFPREDIVP